MRSLVQWVKSSKPSSVITPIPVLSTSIIDCLVLIGITAVFYIPARLAKTHDVPDTQAGGRLTRPVGAVMVLIYVAYTVYLIVR